MFFLKTYFRIQQISSSFMYFNSGSWENKCVIINDKGIHKGKINKYFFVHQKKET